MPHINIARIQFKFKSALEIISKIFIVLLCAIFNKQSKIYFENIIRVNELYFDAMIDTVKNCISSYQFRYRMYLYINI